MSSEASMSELGSKMEDQAAIEALLASPVLARIATADPVTCQPHVVPVWFAWDGKSLWISSFTNTRKVRELRLNPKCSVLIEPTDSNISLQAVIFEGEVEFITQPKEYIIETATRIYARYLGSEGVLSSESQSWLYDPHHLIIKLTPQKIITW
jgi:nitroimidazol reductase NimA-like FMN-containing flavoprotein (pyridoxamine 5'-phosphate oxidase superfamily)